MTLPELLKEGEKEFIRDFPNVEHPLVGAVYGTRIQDFLVRRTTLAYQAGLHRAQVEATSMKHMMSHTHSVVKPCRVCEKNNLLDDLIRRLQEIKNKPL